MAFPASPTVGEKYPTSDPIWEWDGTVWSRLFKSMRPKVITGPMVPLTAFNIECDISNYFRKTVDGTAVFTFSSPPPTATAYSFALLITYTSGTMTWPAGVIWPRGGILPELETGKRHLLVFFTYDGGVTWFGAVNENYAGS